MCKLNKEGFYFRFIKRKKTKPVGLSMAVIICFSLLGGDGPLETSSNGLLFVSVISCFASCLPIFCDLSKLEV